MIETGCKYCKNESLGKTHLLYHGNDEDYGQVAMGMWIIKDIIRFYTWGFGSRRDYSIVINFCPMCGRELEKRECEKE
jgi:hypothetical protein